MPAKLLKVGIKYTSKQLAHIFNHLFLTGTFPDKLKLAYVVPIHKADSKLSVGEYRHISILPIISKILEKLMAVRLQEFLKVNNIIYEHQFGFQPGKSTNMAILDIHAKIVQAFEDKRVAACVFLDFAKAFDTVNHEILEILIRSIWNKRFM